MYREQSVWDRYRWHIGAGVSLILVQTALIGGLLLQRKQRMRAQRSLARNLRFEQLVSEISNTFATVAPAHVDAEIQTALGRIVAELDFNRGSLIEFTDDPQFLRVTHSVTTPGVAPLPANLAVDRFPWAIDTLRRGDVVQFTALDRLPPDAAKDRAAFLDIGTQSIVCVPLDVGGAIVGGLSFATRPPADEWDEASIQRLRLLGQIFANALVRRRAESAVRESEERFRMIADVAPVMVWMAGTDGGCTYLNRGWLEFTGGRMEEQLGDGWAAGVHPDDRDRCVGAYRHALDKREEFVLEYRLRRHDGVYRWLAEHGVPRRGRDGTFSGYVGACTDITDIKAAHMAVLKSVALRSAIFGSLYGHVAAVNREGRILAINESWARFGEAGGWDTLRPGVGRDYLAACLQAAADGDVAAQQIEEAIRSVIDGHRQRASLEYAAHSGGEEHWFEMNVEPFHHPDGGAIVSHLDITRRRLAEIDARRQREQLAHALRVTTLGELASSLAHEISQPLAAILSNAQAARHLLPTERPAGDDVEGALVDIAADAKRAALVIRRLRALLRKEWVERKSVDVNALVGEVANLLHGDLAPKGVLVELSLAKDLAQVVGDVIQLQQVVLNVIVNGSEAMVGASTDPALLMVATSQDQQGTVEIKVRDCGPGVPEAELERIFEPFVTTKKTGLGMGLSISRSIVQAHGGRIWATRNEDRGLTIHIELPCDEDGNQS